MADSVTAVIPKNYGLTKYLTTKKYPMNDLSSVYTHYDSKTGRNIPAENKLKKVVIRNGKSS